MGRMLISAFADEYDKDGKIHTAYLESKGIKYIEPRFVNGINVADLTKAEAAEYKSLLDSHGITASAIGSPIGKINLADDFDEHLVLARRCFENARILGAKFIRMFSFYLKDGQTREQARVEVIERISALLDLADEYGLTLCHENEANIYGEDADHCLDLMCHFGGRLKCVFDTGNFILDGVETYPYAYELLRDHIAYFHIKDSLSVGAIVPPGCGEGRILDVLKAHRRNYEGDFFVSLEPHLETFDGLNKLVGKKFENPYKFESKEIAFDHARELLFAIIDEVNA